MPIYLWPCALITARTVEVVGFDRSLFLLCERLAKTLEATRSLIAGDMLAATQIGDTRRVVAVRVNREQLVMLVNPVVLDQRSMEAVLDQDLSFPAASVEVTRPRYMHVEYSSLVGQRQTMTLTGQAAIDAHRGIEYLNGRSLFDHAGWFKRRALRSKYKKSIRMRFPTRVDHLSQQAAWHLLTGGRDAAQNGEEE